MVTEIKNVRIFDGNRMIAMESVMIDGDKILMEKPSHRWADSIIEGAGCTLLPGLMDGHVHIEEKKHIENSVKWGVTTMADMSPPSKAVADSLRNVRGLTDIITSYAPASYPTTDPERFVADRVKEGAEFIKVLLGHARGKDYSVETVKEIVEAAHNHNRMVVAHATTLTAYRTAMDAGVDVITHIPMEAPLPKEMAAKIAAKGIAVIPTMTMMKAILMKSPRDQALASADFANVQETVARMIAAHITIVAGTDANFWAYAPAHVPHGESLIEEIAMYVEAGMTPAEALRSATSLAAGLFGLSDRGTIETGKRADLLLVEGNPDRNIRDLRNVRGVWVNGVPADMN